MMNRIIITGASSGLGMGVARSYASRGWRVGVGARRLERLEALKQDFPDLVEIARIDITSPDASEQLSDLIKRTGGMDIFLQAAGVGKQNLALDSEIERNTVMTNCVGFTTMIDTAFNYFRHHPSLKNVLAAITSVAATRGLGSAPSYSASKRFETTYLTALEQLSHLENIPLNIVDIRPGFIATDLLDNENHYPMMMTPEHAIPLIVKAIDQHRRVAIIDSKWWWLVKAWQLVPRWLWVRFPARTRKNVL